MELQALPSRIGQVRRIVSAQLRYWHLDPLIDPAALGVTELLTNVHRHAEPDKQCTVEIALMMDRLTVSVRDQDPRLPRVRECDPVSTHGRGLALVAAVSQTWGMNVRDDGSGKVVWFTLAVPQPATVNGSPCAAYAAGRTAPPPHRTSPAARPVTAPTPTSAPAPASPVTPVSPVSPASPVTPVSAPAPVAAPAPAPAAASAPPVRERAPAARSAVSH